MNNDAKPGQTMRNSDVDNLDSFGQARRVEAPPVLKAQPDAPKPKRKGRGKFIIFAVCVGLLLAGAVYYAVGR